MQSSALCTSFFDLYRTQVDFGPLSGTKLVLMNIVGLFEIMLSSGQTICAHYHDDTAPREKESEKQVKILKPLDLCFFKSRNLQENLQSHASQHDFCIYRYKSS